MRCLITDYMLAPCILILLRAISSRCLNRSVNLNLSTFTGILWRDVARAMHLSSAFSCSLYIGLSPNHNLLYRYKRSEDARMALEQMEGFELAGRTVRHPTLRWHILNLQYRCSQLRVNTVHEKGTAKYTQADTLDEAGGALHSTSIQVLQLLRVTLGGNLNAASRQALMQKLARIEPAPVQPQPMRVLCVPSSMPKLIYLS